ncbi:MAG: hypothetical protein K2W84_12215 [Burkholderiales bacterium]|nr:hypothetical protein [Burkholderiales bacterium]
MPATSYSSAYTGYRSWRDEPPASWRAANDEAARIGGHIGMFGGGAGTAPATPGAAAKPAPQHHHGHGGMK